MIHPFNKGRTVLIGFVGILAVASMMGLLQDSRVTPADAEGRVIDGIEFDGLMTVDPVYLQGVAGIKPGQAWNREEIAAACRRLAATQKFEGTPFAEPREVNGQLVLLFVVQERPFVTAIEFIGNEKFDAGDLLAEIELEVGSPISEFLISQAEEQIELKYKEEGYAYASVEVDREILRDDRRALFRVSEGPRVRVKEIVFEGNTAFSDLRLKSLIETATYIWLFRTGSFDPETADRDAAAIKSFYIARGYLNAQVGYRADPYENSESDLTITFQIEEGLQHVIKSVVYDGNSVFSDDAIQTMMNSLTGAVIDSDILKNDLQNIQRAYGELGYLYVDVSGSHVFDEEDGFVHLTVRIIEGDQYRFGLITIRGNRQTQDRVIRRELRFFPEELYDTEKVKKAELRLVETRLFNEASIKPQGDVPGIRDALVTVEEADTTTILFGLGVTSNSGVVGSISIEQRNFDLLDWPRSSEELFKFKSFRGAGQTLRLNLEPGTELTRGRLEFREPYLFDREMGFGMGLYAFERSRDAFDERRIGFTTSLDKRWREGFLNGWAGEIAFRFENINVSDTDNFTAEEIRDDEGNNWLTTVKGTLIRDKTDSHWLPSEGDRLKLSVEQAGVFGGDHTFTKAMGTYDRYWTLKTDNFGRKHVIQLGGTIGNIFGDAPVFERFFAGGIGSIRGFEFRGISPRAGIRDDRIGGDFMLLTNAQYSFPLVGKTVRGVTFLDMGTVEEDFGLSDWRASVGVGVRIYVKYFGPIPLSFDLAAPISKDSEDDTQVFNFSFGTTF
ncbi:MAG: outer membrane protein assembly factor BamA [Phycisphaerales bacterium]|nr:outer membrane protein assembly factor BamA [Phycisphaerales bacterium]